MKIKVNVCSETLLLNIKGDGVNRAFVDCIELLKESDDIEVIINSDGLGNLMHSHTYGPYFFWRGLKYRGRKIFTVHVIPATSKGTIFGWQILMPFFKWYLKQVYNYADVCIAISPMVEKTMIEMGVTSKIVRMNNPLPIEKWKRTEELRKKGRNILGIKDGEFCVLGVGQLQPRKGCEDFIEIGGKIPDAQFRWIGGHPMGLFNEGTFNIQRKISQAASNVKFAGLFDMDEMPCLYAAADLLIFPSYQENCPYVPLEAAASGVPVIFRDLVEYEQLYNVNFLKASSNEEFASITKKLIKDKSEYQKGLEISEKLILQFDKNEIKKSLFSLYSALAKGENKEFINSNTFSEC